MAKNELGPFGRRYGDDFTSALLDQQIQPAVRRNHDVQAVQVEPGRAVRRHFGLYLHTVCHADLVMNDAMYVFTGGASRQTHINQQVTQPQTT